MHIYHFLCSRRHLSEISRRQSQPTYRTRDVAVTKVGHISYLVGVNPTVRISSLNDMSSLHASNRRRLADSSRDPPKYPTAAAH